MFHNQKILELQRRVCDLKNKLEGFEYRTDKIPENLDDAISKHTNEIEKRLLEFHKEITDRYFSTLERILRVHSESSLITALAHQVNQKDLTNLRSTLLKPFLEEKWRQDEMAKGEKTDDNIKSLGKKLVMMRKELHEEMLKKEREEQPIEELKGKIEILNLIIGDKL